MSMDPAKVKTEWTVEPTLMRGTKRFKVGPVDGSRFRRIYSSFQIMRWNRWAKKDSARRGWEFPDDAPVRLRDLEWKKLWNG